ncbi:MAG: hypothetical protein NTY67_14825 [Cyanobacteria bacterium]|nr:hypothetical protein [Cyanobacteriota bacterium]
MSTSNSHNLCQTRGRSITSAAASLGFAILALGASLLPAPVQAGPIARRYQERKACETFAGKLKEASGNPAMAQQIYQQGVLALVAKFGENPCGDIPAPVAVAPGTGAAVVAPAGAPAAAPAVRPAAPAAAAPAASAAPSAEQQQACSTFASKLTQAAASGGAAQAKQVFSMGTQKLTGMFGPNPCPAVKAPI